MTEVVTFQQVSCGIFLQPVKSLPSRISWVMNHSWSLFGEATNSRIEETNRNPLLCRPRAPRIHPTLQDQNRRQPVYDFSPALDRHL
jgi:hypothetical protein